VTVNISSPNTKDLRRLQQADELALLLGRVVKRRDELAKGAPRRVPLAVKIAPDLDEEQVAAIAKLAVDFGIDAVIATNTTVSRAGTVSSVRAGGQTIAAGVRGAPLPAAPIAGAPAASTSVEVEPSISASGAGPESLGSVSTGFQIDILSRESHPKNDDGNSDAIDKPIHSARRTRSMSSPPT